MVVARGGFSGIFPDSSLNAFFVAVQTSLPNVHIWCDVQLTKDGRGICFPDIRLENASNIDAVYPKGRNTYMVNGVSTTGWFSVDFTLRDLGRVNSKLDPAICMLYVLISFHLFHFQGVFAHHEVFAELYFALLENHGVTLVLKSSMTNY